MQKNLRLVVVFSFAILAISGILSTLIETKIWSIAPIIRTNIIRFHVSWSVLFCIVIGMVLEGHVRNVKKYKNSTKKTFGSVLLIGFFFMILSSFVIRHIKIPSVHSFAITAHWVLGLTLIAIFIAHFFLRKKKSI